MTDDESRRRLKRLIERLYNEITELHHHREIWQFFNEELPKHGGGRGIIHQALVRWYVDSQAAAIRRIAGEGSHDKQSLFHTLKLIETNYSNPATDSHGISVTTKSIQDDLNELTQATQPIARWASENVCHIGRKRSVNPTFDQLDRALDCMGRLLQKYFQFVDGGYLSAVNPVIPEDWRRPFRERWL